MHPNSFHIGFTTKPYKRHAFDLGTIDGSYTAGDVLSSSLITLNCTALAKDMLWKPYEVHLWEKSPAGTQVKAGLRFHFFKSSFTPPAQNAPFKFSSASYGEYLGHIDVATGDYYEVGDGAGTDPDFAFACTNYQDHEAPTFASSDVANANWMVVEITETKTFATGAILKGEILTWKL